MYIIISFVVIAGYTILAREKERENKTAKIHQNDNHKMPNNNEKELNTVLNGVAASLVIDFLKVHGHRGIASKLETYHPELPDLHGLKLTDMFSYFKLEKNTSEEESDNYKLFGTTIRQVYGHLEPVIDALSDSEVKKTFQYIMKSNAKARNFYKDTGLLTTQADLRRVFPELLTGNFTRGKESEESQIRAIWNDLVQNVPILDPPKLFTDLEQLTKAATAKSKKSISKQLPNLLGCHLSSQLHTSVRTARQIFEFIKTLVLPYVTGPYTEEEEKTIKTYFKKHDTSKESFEVLAKILNRKAAYIKKYYVRQINDKVISGTYTGDEDQKILTHFKEHGVEKESVQDLGKILDRNPELLKKRFLRLRNKEDVTKTIIDHLKVNGVSKESFQILSYILGRKPEWLRMHFLRLRDQEKVADLQGLQEETKEVKVNPQDEDLDHWMTIQDAYGNKIQDIDKLDKDESEVSKVVRYILVKQNIPIKRIHVVTSHITNLHYIKRNHKKFPSVRTSVFTKSSYGASSEQSCIDMAWNELIDQVPICDPNKCIQDFYNLKQLNWPKTVLGCYLVKNFKVHRFAFKVFQVFAEKEMNRYNFQPDEDDAVLDHFLHNPRGQKAKMLEIMAKLDKPRYIILERFRLLTKKTDLSLGNLRVSHFDLNEDSIILKQLFGKDATSDDVKKVSLAELKPLENILSRKLANIRSRWVKSLTPVLLTHLAGAVSVDWKLDFLHCIANNSNYVAIQDIDWNDILERWPTQTKMSMMIYLSSVTRKHKNYALHERATLAVQDFRQPNVYPKVKAHHEALIEIFDDIRGIKPISVATKLEIDSLIPIK